MTPFRLRRRIEALCCCVTAALVLAGCKGYSYSINNRVVYAPPSLFSDYAIDDANLRACVAQAISDGGVTRAEALVDLNCSNAGISSLKGIEVFTQLRRLGLDGNRITDLTPLLGLAHLELLQLRDNALPRVGSQICQGAKKQLALAGNKSLDCASLAPLPACGVTLVDVPEHCAPAQ